VSSHLSDTKHGARSLLLKGATDNVARRRDARTLRRPLPEAAKSVTRQVYIGSRPGTDHGELILFTLFLADQIKAGEPIRR
jgi:urease gamma subunit